MTDYFDVGESLLGGADLLGQPFAAHISTLALDTLVSFGNFNFENAVTHGMKQNMLVDNFGEVIPVLTRLVGMNGAFYEYPGAAPPEAPGVVRATYWMIAPNTAQMRWLRSGIAGMLARGLQKLRWRSFNGDELECDAILRKPDWPRQVVGRPHRNLRVNLEFDVPSPGWRALSDTTVQQSITMGTGTLTVDLKGQADALPRVVVTAGASLTKIQVRRMVNNEAADDFAYTGNMASGDELAVDCARRTVEVDDVDQFTNFSAETGDWLLLDAQVDNTLRVDLTPNTASATVSVEYKPRYYHD